MLYVIIALLIAIFWEASEKKQQFESIEFYKKAFVFCIALIFSSVFGTSFLIALDFPMAKRSEQVETYDLALNQKNEYYDVQEENIMFFVHDTLEDDNRPIPYEMEAVRFKEGESASITVTKEVTEWTTVDTAWFFVEPLEKESVKEVVCTIPGNDCINDKESKTDDDVRKYCTKCQMELESTWNFCGNCGEKISKQ